MLNLTTPEIIPVAELPDLRLKVPTVERTEAMPLAAMRSRLTEVERTLTEVQLLTTQAESFQETLIQRAEKAEESRRWLEAENRELHERLQKLEERVPKWVRKLLGA